MITFRDLFNASCLDVYYQVEKHKYEKLTSDNIKDYDNYIAVIITVSIDYSLYIKKWVRVDKELEGI